MTTDPYTDPYAADPLGATGATGAHAVGAPTSDLGPSDDRSIGEIVGDIAKDASTLMRTEIELAKTEAKEEAKKAGKGIGMLVGAALFGLLTLFALTLFLIQVLDNALGDAWSPFIITVLWAVVAGVLAMLGKKALQQTNPALPTTQQTLKEDVQWAKDQKSS